MQYLDLINKTIQQEVLKYAIPVYDYDFLKNPENYGSITFTVDSDVLLEMIFLQIQGETIKSVFFFLKKETNLKEEELIRDIEEGEKLNITSDVHFDVLSDKKAELEKIRQIKIKGEQIRSRVQWLDQGEKPTKYFCNLENKNYVEKTIRNIQLDNGSFITDQNLILHQIKKYYQNLFKDKDHTLNNVDLQEVFKNIPYKKSQCYRLRQPNNTVQIKHSS